MVLVMRTAFLAVRFIASLCASIWNFPLPAIHFMPPRSANRRMPFLALTSSRLAALMLVWPWLLIAMCSPACR
ncbi:hypothetical protein D3C71_2099730 [compost metagenome]